MSSGKPEAVRKDQTKKTGSMRQKSYDPELPSPDPVLLDQACPKCGFEMELIEAAEEVLPFQQLQLCPGCYLVMWRDQNGLHVGQGVPMKKGVNYAGERGWAGEPKKC